MILSNKIQGKNICLRSVCEEDADFILQLRTDDSLNQYIHKTEKNVKKQVEWIKKQIVSEGDYYFVVLNKENHRVGLASIYNICEKEKSAEFGRWISKGNPMENLETVLLAHDFAFDELGLEQVYTRTMSDNKKVRSFWKRFGGRNIGDIFEEDLLLNKNIVSKEAYKSTIRPKNMKLIR